MQQMSANSLAHIKAARASSIYSDVPIIHPDSAVYSGEVWAALSIGSPCNSLSMSDLTLLHLPSAAPPHRNYPTQTTTLTLHPLNFQRPSPTCQLFLFTRVSGSAAKHRGSCSSICAVTGPPFPLQPRLPFSLRKR